MNTNDFHSPFITLHKKFLHFCNTIITITGFIEPLNPFRLFRVFNNVKIVLFCFIRMLSKWKFMSRLLIHSENLTEQNNVLCSKVVWNKALNWKRSDTMRWHQKKKKPNSIYWNYWSDVQLIIYWII